jgi:ParB/RepB/Spo0J family partition protein
MRSIIQVGIQVPLSVYKKKNKFILIDGERRWRCAVKLGLTEVPIIIEPEPTPLENLLMMFNIHNVRVHWDLLALAFKVKKVRELVQKEREIILSKKELADLTGVTTATIARCEELISLPEKYLDLIWAELEKPKGEQKYTEDLFLEIKKSIKTIENYLPEIFEDYSAEKMLDIFFEKYAQGVEVNRVRFRDISKIARGELVGVPRDKTLKVIRRFLTQSHYTIESAFQDSVADAYSERTTERKLYDLINVLQETPYLEKDDELRDVLLELRKEINRLIK